MNIIQTNIPGVLIIEPRVFKDSCGYFFESFSQREFDEPTNEARAKSNLFELCLARRSKTKGQKVTPILGHSINFVQDNESMSSYGVMRGLHYQRMPYTQSKLVRCVNGAVLDVAVDIRKGSPTFGQHVSCLLTGRDEEGMKIYVTLGIDWKIPTEHANLSEKDTKHAMLKDFDSPFDINVDLYN